MSAFTVEADGTVAVIVFDKPGPVNTLTVSVGDELLGLLARLGRDSAIEAAVLISGKRNAFIAGADIDQFVALESEAEAKELSHRGQQTMESLEAWSKPIVAAIHGACLGGGLEMALATRYRLATDASVTQLGFPEVQLGIIPAAGGCIRLPRLVGASAALDMILTGRPVRAAQALRLGLVDDVVPPAILRATATAAAKRLAGGWQPQRTRTVRRRLLDENALGRAIVFRRSRAKVANKTAGHYPAPLAAIEAIEHGLAHGHTAGLGREAELFARLAVGPVSRHLVQVFFATTALKKLPDGDLDPDTIPTVERLGVVGAGFMGAAIAGVAALRAGVDVRVRDTDWPRVSRGLKSARRVLDDALQRKRIDKYEHAHRTALLSGSPALADLHGRDFVVEAVFEDLEVKRQIIEEMEAVVGDQCVIASNTSTIPIGHLQKNARQPERIVGMHFFSPVERMPLIELIRGPSTAPLTVARAARFGQRLGKTVVVVNDSPGFWVNRILAPYINEAGWLVEEGVEVTEIDDAMTSLGFPVGPLSLIDEVGLDVSAKAAAVLEAAFGDRLAPAPVIRRLIEAGRLGRKSGRGFYRYSPGKKTVVDERRPTPDGAAKAGAVSRHDVSRRPFLALLNEAARGSAEGIIQHPRDGDVAAIMGFGFPPYLGGPLRHLDDAGAEAIVSELEQYASRIGPRFAPAEALIDMARTGRTFYR
jgi:3-hydroxyacyl-CoA dehydrogenase/enoyl-CoA hydratase/3-hydroxybutyryl-CoA epimerase